MLFSREINELPVEVIFDDGYYCPEIGIPCEFSRRLLTGTCQHLQEIDALISETTIDWNLMRLPLTDKSILRLAIYEMLFEDDIPTSVSIDEAVEMAKDFGGSEKSPIFINGVLGKIACSLQPDVEPCPEGRVQIDDEGIALNDDETVGEGFAKGAPAGLDDVLDDAERV